MVSHEVNVVYKLTDRVICLNRDLVSHGETCAALTPEVLRRLYGDNAGFMAHEHGERHG